MFVLVMRRLVILRSQIFCSARASNLSRQRRLLIGHDELRHAVEDDPAGGQCRGRGDGHTIFKLLELNRATNR